jgi:hypothetical protein
MALKKICLKLQYKTILYGYLLDIKALYNNTVYYASVFVTKSQLVQVECLRGRP